MAFDLLAAVMAILSVLSFGAIGGTDITDDTQQIELSGVTDTSPEIQNPQAEPENTEQKFIDSAKPGAHLIAGKWTGTSSIPFVASVEFNADIKGDGTAQFSGSLTSSMFGNHDFESGAEWEYLGGDKFNAVISGTDTAVTCSGEKLTFKLNPYKLGLTDNELADQEFTITLHRI
ncbi:MAG: hypothetical protein IKY09_00830 [Methanocorpusculum sp.]|jgi:hypothetical protein|nr:hypothetical protein [Methanocorpusculum sp.]MBR5143038.1 hypothetical protein [Methanocorpusculum sp.]HJJ85104.1 hypothetical protein [Methanocorpusculum sp.]